MQFRNVRRGATTTTSLFLRIRRYEIVHTIYQLQSDGCGTNCISHPSPYEKIMGALRKAKRYASTMKLPLWCSNSSKRNYALLVLYLLCNWIKNKRPFVDDVRSLNTVIFSPLLLCGSFYCQLRKSSILNWFDLREREVIIWNFTLHYTAVDSTRAQ